jgi:hypothetical protein
MTLDVAIPHNLGKSPRRAGEPMTRAATMFSSTDRCSRPTAQKKSNAVPRQVAPMVGVAPIIVAFCRRQGMGGGPGRTGISTCCRCGGALVRCCRFGACYPSTH